ncbi:hypothetical protein ACRALDRAFT_2033624 [Sodiomyces alcalophilus JCM 7366]|uniref:uncharacterized protein n=1 Tax=Sodiomyces alcalophilus JCM 7366 TaxID=591952 RepID=UPI0039B4E764
MCIHNLWFELTMIGLLYPIPTGQYFEKPGRVQGKGEKVAEQGAARHKCDWNECHASSHKIVVYSS